MTMPTKAVDRLFERLAATYTTQWVRQFDHVPMQDVKTAWAHELSEFSGRLECLAWALENLPAKCLNVIEFKNLCRSAPRPEEPRLPEPKADPARIKAELAKLGELRAKSSPVAYDGKAWARRILSRSEAGERINPTTMGMAKAALRAGSVLELA